MPGPAGTPQSVTVVVPLYNNAEHVLDQLNALATQEYTGPWEVVVADNGSSDGSFDIAQRHCALFPSFKVIDASDVRGVSHARNAGARSGSGDLILYTDADDVVKPGWVTAMVEGLEACELVGGLLDDDALNAPELRSWLDEYHPHDRLPVVNGYLPMALGANFGIRRSVFDEIGGWNEDYIYGEDVEICWRAQVRGFRICFVPDAVVMYRHRASVRGLMRQQFFRARQDHRRQLALDFAPFGYSPPPDTSKIREKAWRMVVDLPAIPFSRPRRGLWLRNAAYGLGWVAGKWDRRSATPRTG